MAKLKFETTANLKPIDNLLTRIKELEQHIASLKKEMRSINAADPKICLLYTSPSPRDH